MSTSSYQRVGTPERSSTQGARPPVRQALDQSRAEASIMNKILKKIAFTVMATRNNIILMES